MDIDKLCKDVVTLNDNDKKKIVNIILDNNPFLEYKIEDNLIALDFSKLSKFSYQEIYKYIKSIKDDYLVFEIIDNEIPHEKIYKHLSKGEINLLKRENYENNDI